LRSAADYELMLRVLLRYDTHAQYIPEVLVKMRAGGMSNASLKNRLRANKEDVMAWKLNDLKPYFFTTWLKPIRKILQFNPINIWQK
jgi:glycosyltransferase